MIVTPLPTLRQLRYLVALSEIRHFGRAAEACLVTQSTLSAGILELEGLLGVTLFERTRRRVLITPEGGELAERARRVLAEAEGLVETARQAKGTLQGPLALGVIPTIGPFLLPRLVPAVRERFPGLRLYLREDQTARLLAQLVAGDLDLLILAFPYDAPAIERYDFATDGFWLACPRGHAMAEGGRVAVTDIPEDELLLLEDGHCLRDHVLAACRLLGLHPSPRMQGTSLQTVLHMVAGGLGITLLPEMAVEAGMAAGLDVVVRPLEEGAGTRNIGLAWRSTSGRGQQFRALGAFLAERFGATPAAAARNGL